MHYSDSHVYNGDFVNGKKHGFGIYKFDDNTTYKGEF